MNIVHIEDFFHPNAGYQINILPKYMVKQGHSVTIITSEMEKVPRNLTSFFGDTNIEYFDNQYRERTGVKIIRLPLKGFISGRAVFSNQIFKKVDSLNPDILYVHGNDTLIAIRYLLKIRKIKYPIVMDSHMLEMASVNKFNKLYRFFYSKIIAPIIIKNKLPVIRTQDDNYVEKCLGIPLIQCPWISFGSDTLLFSPNETIRQEFRKNNKIKNNDYVVLYTGKLDESKGGLFLAEAFLKKFSIDKTIVLVVVGNTDGEYGEKIEKLFESSENRVIRFPTQKYADLASFYQAADLSVFPKQCSLSFYDAQACGLPVLLEDNNININRLQHNNGFLFEAGNLNDLRSKIVKCASLENEEYQMIKKNSCDFVKNNYDYEIIAKQYTDILLDEVKKFVSTT